MGRAEKYAAKLNGEIIKQRYDATKALSVEQETAAIQEQIKIDAQIKIIAENAPVILQHFYMAFAKEICKKRKIFQAQTLLNEIEILQQKWIKRGLDWNILDNIKTFYVQPYVAGNPFLMDISLLDSNDRIN